IDNSIVMLENIFRHSSETDDPEAAAHIGANEVQSAVIASTATNVAAVVPFLLISGLAALIFRELILTITFAIIASLGVALTIVPMLSAQLAKVRFASGINRWVVIRAVDRAIDFLRSVYRRIAYGAVVRGRWAIIGTGAVLLAGAFWLTRDLGTEFMVAHMPYVEHVFPTAGGFLSGSATAERAGRGSMSIVLTPASQRDMTADQWVRTLQARIDERGFPGAAVFVRPPRIPGLRTSMSGSDIAINVQGDDLRELQRIADEIIRRVQGVPGL